MGYYNSVGLSRGYVRLNGTQLWSAGLIGDHWRSIVGQWGSLGLSGSNWGSVEGSWWSLGFIGKSLGSVGVIGAQWGLVHSVNTPYVLLI